MMSVPSVLEKALRTLIRAAGTDQVVCLLCGTVVSKRIRLCGKSFRECGVLNGMFRPATDQEAASGARRQLLCFTAFVLAGTAFVVLSLRKR